jgi:tripartite-type tricarboxylate transporter receptor subunit TctC
MNLILPAALAAALVAAPQAWAQAWPSKTVRIIVPHPAGGPVDLPPRGVAQELSKTLGQPFIIENRDGGDGFIGAEACAKAPPDGHTFCTTASSVITINPLVRSRMPYDPVKDFAPVVQLGALNSVFVTSASVPVNSMGELVELAKAKPNSLTFATLGGTSLGPIFIGWVRNDRGAQFYQIPFKSTIQGLQAAIAGEVNVATYAANAVAPQVRAGKIKALAVTGNRRSSFLPDVPTIKEAGFNFDFRSWVGMFAPAATPREIVKRMNAETARLLADAQFREQFITRAGVEVDEATGRSPEEFAEFLRTDRELIGRLVELAGIPKQ